MGEYLDVKFGDKYLSFTITFGEGSILQDKCPYSPLQLQEIAELEYQLPLNSIESFALEKGLGDTYISLDDVSSYSQLNFIRYVRKPQFTYLSKKQFDGVFYLRKTEPIRFNAGGFSDVAGYIYHKQKKFETIYGIPE